MTSRYGPLLAALTLLSCTPLGFSQAPASPETAPEPRPAAYLLPPFGEAATAEPIVNPILDDSPSAGPGWFTNVDLLLVRPHIGGQLEGSPNGGANTLTLTAQGPLGTTASPTFELGYRLPEQRGEFTLKYRFELGDQTGTPADVPAATAQRDRLNLNQMDLDWGGWHPWALGPGWNLRFNAGVRMLSVYYDMQQDFGTTGNAAKILSQRATNDFVGAGPEAGVEVTRELFHGLGVFGRLSGADVFGDVHQTFSATATGGPGPAHADASFSYQASAPILALEAGLAYTPPGWNYSRVLVGYVWEEYWQIGRLNESTGDLLNRGAYVRVEINY